MQSLCEIATKDTACITFYDEKIQTVRTCTVPRSHVQTAIDRALVLNVPPDAPEHSDQPITNEDARKLGGMAYLILATNYPELRARLKITTAEPINWSPIPKPG